jgi:hypothetical protein
MKYSKLVDHALLWLALGAALLGLVALQQSLSGFIDLPREAWNAFLICGAISSAIGITLGLVSVVIDTKGPTEQVFERAIFGSRERNRFVAFAKSGDLARLRNRYEENFGRDIPSLDLMEAWFNRYARAFVLVYEGAEEKNLDVDRKKLIGSFKLLPISAEAVEDLERGKVTGSTFKPEHVCSETEAAAFYVGDLFASGMVGGAAVLSHLDITCKQLLDRGFPIYARPFTNSGRRVMRKRGFIQVSDGKEDLELRQLCKLAASKLRRQFRRK